MQHLFLPVRVHSVKIKFDCIHITNGSHLLSSAPMLLERLKVVAFYQCLIGIPVNGWFPSLAPVDVTLDVAQHSEQAFCKVPLRLLVIFRLPGPVLSVPDKITDHRNVKIQLARLAVLHHVYTTRYNIPDGGTALLVPQNQRITGPVN